MIDEQNNDLVGERVAEIVTSRLIGFTCKHDIMIHEMLLDPGDGYRPFHPLAFDVDGVAATVPCDILAGTHLIELTGEQFEGVAFMLLGFGMLDVTQISLTADSSTDYIETEIVHASAYLSGSGPPAASLGKNGDSYWDTTNLMEHRKLGGSWRQVA